MDCTIEAYKFRLGLYEVKRRSNAPRNRQWIEANGHDRALVADRSWLGKFRFLHFLMLVCELRLS